MINWVRYTIKLVVSILIDIILNKKDIDKNGK